MLLDIQMPLMDGYEVCRILREEMNLTIPVIAMTAHALFAEKVKCLLAGMDNYLSKPLSETELLETLVLHTDAIQLHVADRLYLQTISNGDDAFTKRLLEQFLQQSRQELTDLSYTIERKEDKQFRSIIHGMKTTFGYLGLTPDNLKVFERLEQEGLRAESMDLLNQVLDIYLFARHDCTILLNKSEQKDLN